MSGLFHAGAAERFPDRRRKENTSVM